MLYALMFALPLVGWAMLSAGGYPVKLFGTLQLPPIAPIDGPLFAFLRQAHTVFAMTLFTIILAHLGAALFHAWVRRDSVWHTMTLGRSQRRPPTSSIWASRSAGSS
jgi:cytochrome b561